MKLIVLILALLYVPLVIAITVVAMIYAKRGTATRPQGIREYAVVGAVIVIVSLVTPLLILLKVL